jgi:hypothetical protein
MKKNKPGTTKSVSFTSTARAQHEYEQAVQVMAKHPEKSLVRIIGNIVVVPVWYPFSSN